MIEVNTIIHWSQMSVAILLALLSVYSRLDVCSADTLITSRHARSGNFQLVWNFIFPDINANFSIDKISPPVNENNEIHLDVSDGVDAVSEGPKKIIYELPEALSLTKEKKPDLPRPSDPPAQCQKPAAQDPEIYWKDYRGPPVPNEALLVGETEHQGYLVSLHVGQVYVPIADAGLQPVAIYNNTRIVTSTFRLHKALVKNIKILCTNVRREDIGDFLTWIPSDFAWKMNPEEDLVITGYEHDNYVYTGKTTYNGERIVGKACRHNSGFSFFFPYNGKEIWLSSGVQILAYTEAVKKY